MYHWFVLYNLWRKHSISIQMLYLDLFQLVHLHQFLLHLFPDLFYMNARFNKVTKDWSWHCCFSFCLTTYAVCHSWFVTYVYPIFSSIRSRCSFCFIYNFFLFLDTLYYYKDLDIACKSKFIKNLLSFCR